MTSVHECHAFKAAEALQQVCEAALSAVAVREYKEHQDEETTSSRQPKQANEEGRIATLESVLSELAANVQQAVAAASVASGRHEEMHELYLRAVASSERLEEQLKTSSRSQEKQRRLMEEQQMMIATQKSRIASLEEKMERIEAREKVEKAGEAEKAKDMDSKENAAAALISKTEEMMESLRSRLNMVESKTGAGFHTTNTMVKVGLETLANDILLHLQEQILLSEERTSQQERTEMESHAARSQERLTAFWKDADSTMKKTVRHSMRECRDALVGERQRTDMVLEKMRGETTDIHQSLEDQLLVLVETMQQLKQSVEVRFESTEESRTRDIRQSKRTMEKLEELGREVGSGSVQMNQTLKQARHAVRMATEAKEEVREVSREVAKVMGVVQEAREQIVTRREKGGF